MAKNKNSFLEDLLTLQQDGKDSISAPSNWNHPPILDVNTDIDEVLEGFDKDFRYEEGNNKTARWHFLIGSPGNGKSAAIGRLYRNFLRDNCEIATSSGTHFKDIDLDTIPYDLRVYEKNIKFPTLCIVQDASVVRDPFQGIADPATELIQTLDEVWDRGISLLICTNRGVLEKALSDCLSINSKKAKPWINILQKLELQDEETKSEICEPIDFSSSKTIFKSLRVTSNQLDNRSLLRESDTLKQLISKATDASNWETCKSCDVSDLCPFYANRDWLNDEELLDPFLKLLCRAEVLSGQIIVFREALALISLLLAGCPQDYKDSSPCAWVHEKTDTEDYFSLAVRRIYMSMFSSFCPGGLEETRPLRQVQIDMLSNLVKKFGKEDDSISRSIDRVLTGELPTTEVGISRLLGPSGVIASLDPGNSALPQSVYEEFDADFEAFINQNRKGFTDLEYKCVSIWQRLEEQIEFVSAHWISDAHWTIRRWSSNYLLHLYALANGWSSWAKEIDEFNSLQNLLSRHNSSYSATDKLRIRELDKELNRLLDVVHQSDQETSINLSDSVQLVGDWPKQNLMPRTVSDRAVGNVNLAIKFEGSKEQAIFSARMYMWMKLFAEGRLNRLCVPVDLLNGIEDARLRAATKGRYAFEESEIELRVKRDDSSSYRLVRIDGDVEVDDG